MCVAYLATRIQMVVGWRMPLALELALHLAWLCTEGRPKHIWRQGWMQMQMTASNFLCPQSTRRATLLHLGSSATVGYRG